MICGTSPPTLSVESPLLLNGWVISFDGTGNWFYTPDEPPKGIENDCTSERIENKSRNFPTREEALAFGLGYESDMEKHE